MVILLMYGSHDMRHIGIPQVDGGKLDPRDSGRYNIGLHIILTQNISNYITIVSRVVTPLLI